MSAAGPLQHRARKRFGQNFLHDPRVIARIVDAIDPRPGQNIIEIGPGQAALTRALVERAGHVTALEIDRDLASWLRSEFTPQQLTLIEADALKFDWSSLPGSLRIVGNLPYNISSPLLFALVPIAERVVDQHFMLQKEVVDRMVAGPGSRTYGRLSVDAAVPLPPDQALRRSARCLQSAAEGDIQHRPHAAAAQRTSCPGSIRPSTVAWSLPPSGSVARPCAMPSPR